MMQQQRSFCLRWSFAICAIVVAFWASPLLAAPLRQSTEERQISTIQRIRERDNILVAGVPYDFPPFGVEADDGKLSGFDIDLVKALAAFWGVEVEFVKVTADARIPLLVAGEIDIIAAALPHTHDREATIDFSQTYFVGGQSLLVRSQSGVRSLRDLGNQRVGMIYGTTAIPQLAAAAQAQGVSIEIVSFAEYLPAVDALNTGTIEALLADSVTLTQFAQVNSALEVVGTLFTPQPYGLGVQSGDSRFRHWVDATLQQLKLNGQYDKLYHQWFPTLAPYPITIWPDKWQYTLADSPGELAVPQQSRVANIQRERRLTVAVPIDAAPFSSLNEAGNCCTGFAVDLTKELARRWLGDENTVQYLPITTASLTRTLNLGNWDILATSLPSTWQHAAIADFSQPYWEGSQLMPKRASLPVTDIASLPMPVSLGLPANDYLLRDLVNFTLQSMTQDGRYQQIYQRWFPSHTPYPIEIWPGAPTDPAILQMMQIAAHLAPAPAPLFAVPGAHPVTSSESVSPMTTPTAESSPGELPGTGGSMYSYHTIPFVLGLIVLWLGGSIYHQHNQQAKKQRR